MVELPSCTITEVDSFTNRNLNDGGTSEIAVQVNVIDNPLIGIDNALN